MKDKLLKFIKSHKTTTIVIFTIFFLFLVPPIIKLIVITPTSLGFITMEQQETWIGFYGALIGGAITLGGVAWTIKEQSNNILNEQKRINEQRHKDLENTFLPIPIIIKNDTIYDINVEQTLFTVTIKLSIKNIGKGPMINVMEHGGFLESTVEIKQATEYGGIFAEKYVIDKNESYKYIIYPSITVRLPLEETIVNAYCLISYNDCFGNKRIIKFILPFKIIPDDSIQPLDIYQEMPKN